MSYYGDRVEKMSVAERAWAEEKLGLSDPIYVQYVRWLAGALHGEFGISYKYKMDVLEVIGSRVGNTLILGGIGFVLIFTLAMALACCARGKRNGLSTGSSAKSGQSQAASRSSGSRSC